MKTRKPRKIILAIAIAIPFLLLPVTPNIEAQELVWVVTTDASSHNDYAEAITADDTYIYIAGFDESLGDGNKQWHIEKRRKADGALKWTKTSNPTPDDDRPYSITIDDTYIYIAGYEGYTATIDWHIEKRRKSDGGLE